MVHDGYKISHRPIGNSLLQMETFLNANTGRRVPYCSKACKRDNKGNFYGQRFSRALGTKKTWNTNREIGIGKAKAPLDVGNINANDLNDQFFKMVMTQPDHIYYENSQTDYGGVSLFNFQGIMQDDDVSCFMSITSNSIGVDNIHPRFLKILLPQLLPFIYL